MSEATSVDLVRCLRQQRRCSHLPLTPFRCLCQLQCDSYNTIIIYERAGTSDTGPDTARPTPQALAEDSNTCALYMFPTKALAQDQRAALTRLVTSAFPDAPPAVDVYDGDTHQAERPVIRNRAQLLITNPDMLHVSILPSHPQFERLLANLKCAIPTLRLTCLLRRSDAQRNDRYLLPYDRYGSPIR